MADFSRLSRNWIKWTNLARMDDISVSTNDDGTQIEFTSNDQSFNLRHDGKWWVVDVVDDRGKLHNGIARLSTFDLAEKYLIWRWSSTTRSAIGARQLGVALHALGMAPNVESSSTELEGAAKLNAPSGCAVVPRSIATIFSHVMLKAVDEIEQMVNEGIA